MGTCLYCKKPFVKRHGNQKHCNAKCYNERNKTARKRASIKQEITSPLTNCKVCGVELDNNHVGRSYCSNVCGGKGKWRERQRMRMKSNDCNGAD